MKLFNTLRSEKLSLSLIFFGMGLVVLGIVCFLWFEKGMNFASEIDAAKFGQFGDFIGGIVGSFWALAGVILFYIALTEQRTDIKTNQQAVNLQVDALRQQIREFELQRRELESSRKVYEEQSKTLRTQQFESNFYSLLNVYLTIKDNLNNIDANKDFFKSLFAGLKIPFDPSKKIQEHHQFMVDEYIKIFNSNRGHLSHYFKSFYRIIKIIDLQGGFDDREKLFYAKILRSQLTDYEQIILYYNSHSIYGTKAQQYIIKYNLLKHTPIFNKPEFAYYHNIHKGSNILFFADWLNRFLAKHVNDSYDVGFELERIEESCEYLDCIVGIYFNDDAMELKLFCQKDITKNRIELKEDDFADFVYYLLYDRIVFSTYFPFEKVTLSKFRTETDDSKIFGVKIESKETLQLNNDKY